MHPDTLLNSLISSNRLLSLGLFIHNTTSPVNNLGACYFLLTGFIRLRKFSSDLCWLSIFIINNWDFVRCFFWAYWEDHMDFVFRFRKVVYDLDVHKLLIQARLRKPQSYSNSRPLIPAGGDRTQWDHWLLLRIFDATRLNLLSSKAASPSDSSQRRFPLCLKTSSDEELTSWDGDVCQAQKWPRRVPNNPLTKSCTSSSKQSQSFLICSRQTPTQTTLRGKTSVRKQVGLSNIEGTCTGSGRLRNPKDRS